MLYLFLFFKLLPVEHNQPPGHHDGLVPEICFIQVDSIRFLAYVLAMAVPHAIGQFHHRAGFPEAGPRSAGRTGTRGIPQMLHC